MNNSDIVIFLIEKTQISCFNIDIDEQTFFLFLQKFVLNDPIEKKLFARYGQVCCRIIFSSA